MLVIFAFFCKRLLYQTIFHRHYSYSQYIYHSKPIQQVPFLQFPAGSLHHPRLLGVGSLRLREGESRKWGDGLPPSQAPGWLLTQPSALSAIEHHSLTHNPNHMVGRHASMHFQSSLQADIFLPMTILFSSLNVSLRNDLNGAKRVSN